MGRISGMCANDTRSGGITAMLTAMRYKLLSPVAHAARQAPPQHTYPCLLKAGGQKLAAALHVCTTKRDNKSNRFGSHQTQDKRLLRNGAPKNSSDKNKLIKIAHSYSVGLYHYFSMASRAFGPFWLDSPNSAQDIPRYPTRTSLARTTPLENEEKSSEDTLLQVA